MPEGVSPTAGARSTRRILPPSSSARRRSTSKSVTVMPAVDCRWALNDRVIAECAPMSRTQAATASSA